MNNHKILTQIAAELQARPKQVEAAVLLLDGGATVPFIARYRKEATEGLDDVQLRELEVHLVYAGGAGGTAGDNRHRPAERGQRAGAGAGAHSPGQGQGAMAAAFAKLRPPR